MSKHTIEKFLWFPKRIDGRTRWLVTAKYVQEVIFDRFVFDRCFLKSKYKKRGVKWLD